MADQLTEEAVVEALQKSQWTRDGNAIVRDLRFPDFAAAMAYVNRVADLAEQAGHHPDILVHGFNNVRLTLSTHSVGGLTRADVEMAGRIDEVPPS
jgi:4a-hydroxytetrahydrobiopterin dehydratase